MNREEIFNKLTDFILTTNKNLSCDQVTMDASFEDLNIDSLDGISIITDLEKQYSITLSNEEVNHIRSVSQALDVIEKHLAHLDYAK
jgi:acyl carrier protein